MASNPLHLIGDFKWELVWFLGGVLFSLIKNICSLAGARKAQIPYNIVIVQNSPGSTTQIYGPKDPKRRRLK
jgi:hypothetical protein